MEQDTFQSNLETVKEMILDENKLVTYVSLSKDLCIHVNDSKKLLTKFVENMRQNSPETSVNVSYIISGLSEDSKARTTVVSAAEKDNIQKALKIVFFEHIYSVSKGVPVDRVPYMLVSSFDDISLCKGLLKSTSSCIKHTSDEIGNLKSNCLLVSTKPETKPKPGPAQQKAKEESKTNVKEVSKLHETKSEPTVKTEVPSPKKDAINNVKAKPEIKKNGINKSQKGIAGFFNKSNSAPSKIHVKQEINGKDNKNPVVVKEEKMEVEEDVVEKMDIEEKVVKKNVIKEEKEQKTPKPEPKKRPANGKANNESLSKIRKTAKVDKKRKRLLRVSDSESDNEDKDPFAEEVDIENHESEDEIPPTPATNTVKITSGIINPKKKRKIVDKTFMEDGFMLTKKVEVYESCSDEEEVTKENVKENNAKETSQIAIKTEVKQEISPNGKKNGAKNTKKKVSPPQKGKQATLMNFFKKA